MRGVREQGLRESRRSFGPAYLALFWHLCQRQDLVVAGEAATMLAMGKLLHAYWCFQKKGGFFFTSRSPSFPAITPSILPVHYFYCLCGSPASPLPRRHFYKSSSFNILTITPSSLSLLTSFCPHFSSPSLFSLCLRWSRLMGEDSWQDAGLLPWQQEPSLSLRSP